MIDLRSDTVTKPTPAMRMAMANAVVGDSAYGEDPTVNELETRAAELFEKEAALFVPSGTMANTLAITVHTQHGDEVLCAERSHIVDWELGMAAWYAGCTTRQIPTPDGILSWEQIEPNIRPLRPVFPKTSLICIENPHNMCGGTLYTTAQLDHICDEAHAREIKLHLDGSRIFNASAATGVLPARIAAKADTVMFCLSKGLGAPVGSVLVGSSISIERAKGHRRRLGGGWRQAGILAAAGLVALMDMPKRLHEDHAKAKRLAKGLAQIPGIWIEPSAVVTNIVICEMQNTPVTAEQLVAQLKVRGVLTSIAGRGRVRMVTHFDVSMDDCVKALSLVEEIMAGAASRSIA